MASIVRITTRFNEIEELALMSCAMELGIVDRNGKPKISTFIRVALNSNQLYKTKLKTITNYLEEKSESI